MGRSPEFVLIRAYPRLVPTDTARFFFVTPQIDILRGAQKNRRFAVRKRTDEKIRHEKIRQSVMPKNGTLNDENGF
jgi:hypothetical protein